MMRSLGKVGKKYLLTSLIFLFSASVLLSVMFGAPRIYAAGAGHELNLKEAMVKASDPEGADVYHDLKLKYTGHGYFSNLIPTFDDTSIRFRTDGVTAAAGQMSVVRSASHADGDRTFSSAGGAIGMYVTANDAAKYFTKDTATSLVYDVSLAQTGNKLLLNGTETVYPTKIGSNPASLTSFKGADGIGASLTSFQWNKTQFSAELSDLRITDGEGYDLGVYFSPKGAVSADTSSQRYGRAGASILIKSTWIGRDVSQWKVTRVSDGAPVDLAFASKGNGVYEFTMPDFGINIESAETKPLNGYGLQITNARSRIDNTSADLSFSYAAAGYFGNAIPSNNSVTFEYETMYSNRPTPAAGEVYGVARTLELNHPISPFLSTNAGVGVYFYNGESTNFTGNIKAPDIYHTYPNLIANPIYGAPIYPATVKPANPFFRMGKPLSLTYTKTETAANNDRIKVNQLSVPTGYVRPEGKDPAMPDYKSADSLGAKYTSIYWDGNSKYTARFANFRIYETVKYGETDVAKYDLGVRLSEANRNADGFVNRKYGIAGKTITLKPDLAEGRQLKRWEATREDGTPAELEFTKSENGEWTFVMPEYAVSIDAVTSPVNGYGIEFVNARNKIDNISYSAYFDFSTYGYLANRIPTSKSMSISYYTSSSYRQHSKDDFGWVFGVGRSDAQHENRNFSVPGAAGLFASNMRGYGNTYFRPGQTTVLNYNKISAADGTLAIDAGMPINNKVLGSSVSTFAEADTKARFTSIYWVAGRSSATLWDLKIQDEDGYDLGVYLSEKDRTVCKVDRFADAGQTITVAPEIPDGKIFSGWKAVGGDGSGISLAFTDNRDGTYSFVMPSEEVVVEAVYAESVSVTTAPSKTAYIEGNLFDKTGMVVTAEFSDGTSRVLDEEEYATDTSTKLVKGATSHAVTYTENGVTLSAEVQITVAAKTPISISVTTDPAKTAYVEGNVFDKNGMAVTATYDNGDVLIVTNFATDISTKLVKGAASHAVSYTENGTTVTANVTITVAAKTLTGISIKTNPAKTAYTEGESLDTSGLVLRLTYDNGDVAETSAGFTTNLSAALTPADTEVVVTFGGKTAVYQISVAEIKSGCGTVSGEAGIFGGLAVLLIIAGFLSIRRKTLGTGR